MKATLAWTIVIALLIFLVPDHVHSAPVVQPQPNLTMVDGLGRRVGNVIAFYPDSVGSSAPTPVVALRVDNYLAVLYVRPGEFSLLSGEGARFDRFFWESPDCTGTPLFAGGLPDFGAFPTLFMLDQSLYVPAGPADTFTISSEGTGPSHCLSRDPEDFVTMPVQFLVDLRLRFSPPYVLE